MAPMLGNDSIDDGLPTAQTPRKNILYIDAYDSFSYNVVAMLEELLEAQVTVLMIDSAWPNGNMVEFLQHYEAVVLGPGPGDPHAPPDVGIMGDIWTLSAADMLPVFGICLGFQSLCLRHGATVGRLPYPLHGQVRRVQSVQEDIFEGLSDLEVTLYHSLYAQMESVSDGGSDRRLIGPAALELHLLAWLAIEHGDLAGGVQLPMAVRHKTKPFWGVQFHPESCKSDRNACSKLLRRWWEMARRYKINGRGGYTSLPNGILPSLNAATRLPDIAHTMLDWTASSSNRSFCRDFITSELDAEMICESLNSPGSPTVLFKSNGRYSIVSVPSPSNWRLEYFAQNEKLFLEKMGSDGAGERAVVERYLPVSQFWDVLRYVMDTKKVDSGDSAVPFWAGFLGYFSYEMGLACLSRPKEHSQGHPGACSSPDNTSKDDPADASLLWTERSIILDHETGRVTVQSTREADDSPTGWLNEAVHFLQKLTSVDKIATDTEVLDPILSRGVVQLPNKETYWEQFEACRAQLQAGESYELCLTCETTITLPSPDTDYARIHFPWGLYKRLQKYNPAAFSAYARLGSVKIVSSSPECFLNWDRESTLEMKPMKGTVRKTGDMTLEKARAILGSTKEMAENLMIADLIRHDLYGICGSGGVRVEKLLEVEDHGRVYQMITHVKGQVDPARPGFAARDMPQLHSAGMSVYGLTALQRCLPPGSMTGAPKERSCMHLSSIEARKRGIYSGVMGFLDLGGGGSFSVLIRTAFSSSGDQDSEHTWRIGAGGAITILSTPEGEWDEMLTKLRTVYGVFTPAGTKGLLG
ncbi:para aminobenzoic acid synthetase [Aspergillus heteromorphus CBS 117.55]|uniref:aminodeoxychorismate synthase n=1 Tax=Aspergillus heteromorphus CBS 117.55 TaxID=1448321 RepID=A0A317WAU0_9EURO|nr:para aminobenzoic acid synthetase [Aspergillus heteromorphus CBS 117.55]PWY83025.1 para aminobenzoic acid synthetase [Aspergillus heteromorphus CBS 117.55]